jgi:hypothetical protein
VISIHDSAAPRYPLTREGQRGPRHVVPARVEALLDGMQSRLPLERDAEGNITKPSRLRAYLVLLGEAAKRYPPSDAASALALVNDTLNAIEDRYSGVPLTPGFSRDGGRIYPILDDLYVGRAGVWDYAVQNLVVNQPGARHYTTKANDVLVGPEGSIEIWLSARTSTLTGDTTPPRRLLQTRDRRGHTITA